MMTRWIYFSLFCVALMGCEAQVQYTAVGDPGEIENDGDEEGSEVIPPEMNEQALTPKVDILWVVDNSGSMCEEQASLRDNFDLFIESLVEVEADFQLAVITTDMVDPEESGRFQNIPDGEQGPACSIAVDVSACPSPVDGQEFPSLVLRSRDYEDEGGEVDVGLLARDFGCNATAGTRGNGFEMGLEAAKTALSPALLNGFNSGFLRDDAVLGIFFLTDENDCSDRGALDKTNGNICEWESDRLVPEEEYINFFLGLKGGDADKLFLGGIIAPDQGIRFSTGEGVLPSCVSDAGEGYAGYRYETVVRGVPHNAMSNICQMPLGVDFYGLGDQLSGLLR